MSESDRDWDHVSQSVVSAAAGGQAAAAPGAAGPGGGGRDQPEPGYRRLQPRLDLPQLRLSAVEPGEWAGQQRGRAGGQPQLLAQPSPQCGERRKLRQRPQRQPQQQQQQQRGGAAVRPPEQPQAGLDSTHHAGGETLLLQVSHFLSSLCHQRLFCQAVQI